MKILGIDEAGRGALIGPLVISGVLMEDHKLHTIDGLKDSKKLTPKQREKIFKELSTKTKSITIKIPPHEIDEALESQHLNLNWLEALHIAKLINSFKPDKVIIDCPSPNIKAYEEYIKRHLSVKPKLVLEHKADEKHAIVALASILAKVTRDTEVKKIEERIKKTIGSGYPADEITQKFLKEHHEEHASIFRKSWEPYKRLRQTKLEQF